MTPGAPPPGARRVANLAHLLRATARRLPDGIGLAWGERTWSWAELDRRVDAAAAAFAARGIGKGDRVLIQARNSNALLEALFAAFRIGAIAVPANFRLAPEEVAFLARASGAAALVCDRAFPDHAAAVREGAPSVRFALSIGESDIGESWDALVAAHGGEAAPTADVVEGDPCWLFFTSGTTGRPKGAVLTHGQMAFVVTNHLADLVPGTTDRDASLVVAPLSHGAGIHALTQIARGATTVLTTGERLDPAEAWRLVERWRVTNLFTVPTILKLLAEHPAASAHDHRSLRHVIYAGAPMYREDQKRALAALGPVIVQYYGLGEVTGTITVLPAHAHDLREDQAGTCGWERTGMQVQVQDEAGRELPPGETGEICACGPAVFAGYWENDEANAKAFRNGWFRTGDLGHRDAAGYVFLTGRASDMYISGGSNVYPRETEEKLLQHPDVAACAIVGVPDPTWGEVGVAVCVAQPGAALDEAELLRWLAPKVARYKLPRRVFVWDELPTSGYGKVAKVALKAELERRGLLSTNPSPRWGEVESTKSTG